MVTKKISETILGEWIGIKGTDSELTRLVADLRDNTPQNFGTRSFLLILFKVIFRIRLFQKHFSAWLIIHFNRPSWGVPEGFMCWGGTTSEGFGVSYGQRE